MEKRQSGSFSYGPMVWWFGVVVDRDDPLMIGRVRVRVHGYHSGDVADIPIKDLPWAVPVMPTNSASISGVGSSPTGMVEGTAVIGFFADGHQAQVPMILGTLAGVPDAAKEGDGFSDPKGKYPKFPGESDTNRITKNQKIEETIIKKKKDTLDSADIAEFSWGGLLNAIIEAIAGALGVSIPGPSGGGGWTEEETKYEAKYPMCHTHESESGHVHEIDDTPGKERLGKWHRTGTFEEIHPDGTQVNKSVKDSYKITMKDDYCHIHGDCKITIDGNANVLVKKDATIQVDGDCRHKVGKNYDISVGGIMTVKASLIFLN